ncbi:class I SAM-dependent methyltransferase [Balneola sp. MJW-20]|uniref:class I SAM-dependent methyltransferase n=1 Tax=Gracilimonas aurantiaca TaxID=3234185 RepID=UPI003466059F
MLKEFWDNRYNEDQFAYGKQPNRFLKDQLEKITDTGKILLPLEGEGRNAVYAALMGWDVIAFDQSVSGKEKAKKLADEYGVRIDYQVMDAEQFACEEGEFDLIALIYAHMPRSLRRNFHRKVSGCLKKGGKLILEAFSKEQLGRDSGGPRSVKALYSAKDLNEDLSGLNILFSEEQEVVLDEGLYHQGSACVVRLIAEKV